MEINSAMQSQIASVRQAMGMASMQQAMNQDGETVNKLIEGMEETSKAVQEAAGKDRGNNLDIKA